MRLPLALLAAWRPSALAERSAPQFSKLQADRAEAVSVQVGGRAGTVAVAVGHRRLQLSAASGQGAGRSMGTAPVSCDHAFGVEATKAHSQESLIEVVKTDDLSGAPHQIGENNWTLAEILKRTLNKEPASEHALKVSRLKRLLACLEGYGVGDRVEALHSNGVWFPATVKENFTNGTYLLEWDDGQLDERQKPLSEMRRAIGTGGPEAVRQALSELIGLLQDNAEEVRWLAARAIGNGFPDDVRKAVPELRHLMQDNTAKVRRLATRAIGAAGREAARQALPELKQLLHDERLWIRYGAVEVIARGGAEVVLEVVPEMKRMLLDNDEGVQMRAAQACTVGGPNVVKDAAAHLNDLLDGASNASTRKKAVLAVGFLGQAAIVATLTSLRKILSESLNSTSLLTLPANVAWALRQGDPNSVLMETIPILNQTLVAMKGHPDDVKDLTTIDEVQSTLVKFLDQAQANCQDQFRLQVEQTFNVNRSTVTAPAGYAVTTGQPGAAALQAHRCPNQNACPGEVFNTTYYSSCDAFQPGSCPLGRQDEDARTTAPGPRRGPCDVGYDARVAGCAGCLDTWGRSAKDPFKCQRCDNAKLPQWATWLAHPAALLALSMRSANSAATRGDAAAFANDILKISLSFSSSSTVVVSALASTTTFQDIGQQGWNLLGWSASFTQVGEVAHSSSPDCLLGLGRALSPDELLALSLVNPGIVIAAATPVLAAISRWRGASFTQSLLTLAVVAGNQYVPRIAATCAYILPCFHTQATAVEGGLMAYSTREPREECAKRWTYAPIRALLFFLACAAGPGLWRWLLRHREGGHFVRYLTASYRSEHQAWESNRLVKDIAMSCVIAANPVTYRPGTMLSIAVCTMLTYVCWHVKCQPYKFRVLNYVEAGTLFNLTVCMVLASLIASPAWDITDDFGRVLWYLVFAMLLVNGLLLAAFLVYSKTFLTDEDDILATPQ